MHTKRPKPRTWRPEGPRGPQGFRRRAHAAPWRTREHGRPRGLEKRLKNGVRARPAQQKLRGGTSALAPVLREAACVTPRARRTPATAAVPGASLDSRPHEHRPGAAVSPPVCALCKEVKTATRTWQLVTPAGTRRALPAPRAPCPWASAPGGKLRGPQRKRACDSRGLRRSRGRWPLRAERHPAPRGGRRCLTAPSGGRLLRACWLPRPSEYLISAVCEALRKSEENGENGVREGGGARGRRETVSSPRWQLPVGGP